MSKSLVLREDGDNGVTTITLNDPEKRNAMSDAMAAEFSETISEIRKDSAVRVLVLTGAGRAFSGGGHLDMLFEKTKKSAEENRSGMLGFYESFLSLCELEVPVVAAINGHAIGAGLCIALGCDIRIASNKAKLGLNFVHLALHPGMGATYFLPRLVGPSRAAELLFAGKIITGDQACDYGLVSSSVEAEEFEQEVSQLVTTIAGAGPQAVRELKASLRMSMQGTLQDALKREADCQALDYAGAEFMEGITAAKEKRKPVF